MGIPIGIFDHVRCSFFIYFYIGDVELGDSRTFSPKKKGWRKRTLASAPFAATGSCEANNGIFSLGRVMRSFLPPELYSRSASRMVIKRMYCLVRIWLALCTSRILCTLRVLKVLGNELLALIDHETSFRIPARLTENEPDTKFTCCLRAEAQLGVGVIRLVTCFVHYYISRRSASPRLPLPLRLLSSPFNRTPVPFRALVQPTWVSSISYL